MPMKKYAAKFIMLPIMPSMFEPSMPFWRIQTLPIGAARFVTNEIMP